MATKKPRSYLVDCKSVHEYNARLNAERREERRVSMDLQTYTIHYPIGLGKDNKQLQRHNERTRHLQPRGKYPVATLPGQYQDWFVTYTPQELKYFPLNSVIYGPVVTDPSKLPPLLTSAEEGSPSESDSESTPSEDDMDKSKANESSSSTSSSSDSEVEGPPPAPTLMKERKHKPNATCKICKGTTQSNKSNCAEELVYCSDCDNAAHPSCLELTLEMVDVIKSYPWQCMDCKTCVHCNQPHNEDKMMFCDKCDRGYHTFCVGLKVIPNGKWVCRLCAQCAQCGVTNPDENGWQHETIKIISPNGETLRRHHLLCHSCYKQRKNKA
ncbi:PHD finger protein 10-like protein [Dinothrombium tinctorium]|uniref:PHD finger protein 10 n=1 Tax=Dinothrombium tinctorium TaxID=1965070 RepID=A0A443RN34_9ACAR|nr:PHD finger protein 10-like protein [Dinothrombium tinctorium]